MGFLFIMLFFALIYIVLLCLQHAASKKDKW